MNIYEYFNTGFSLASLSIGIFAIYISRSRLKNWIRLHRVSCGDLITDEYGTNISKNYFNRKGYLKNINELRDFINSNIGSKGYDVIASPAELDYLFPFLLAHVIKKPFCSIHTNNDWPKYLSPFRYNDINCGDRVLIVSIILSTGRYILPAIDSIISKGANVRGVITLIEALPSSEEIDRIEKKLAKKNVQYYALHSPLQVQRG